MMAAIDAAEEAGDTLGGVVEVLALGYPPGVGTYVAGRPASAVASSPAPCCRCRRSWASSSVWASPRPRLPGSQVHDPIAHDAERGYVRASNRAGGIEGGISTGQPIVLRAAMKPISTLSGAARQRGHGHAPAGEVALRALRRLRRSGGRASSSRPSSRLRWPTPRWSGSAARPWTSSPPRPTTSGAASGSAERLSDGACEPARERHAERGRPEAGAAGRRARRLHGSGQERRRTRAGRGARRSLRRHRRPDRRQRRPDRGHLRRTRRGRLPRARGGRRDCRRGGRGRAAARARTRWRRRAARRRARGARSCAARRLAERSCRGVVGARRRRRRARRGRSPPTRRLPAVCSRRASLCIARSRPRWSRRPAAPRSEVAAELAAMPRGGTTRPGVRRRHDGRRRDEAAHRPGRLQDVSDPRGPRRAWTSSGRRCAACAATGRSSCSATTTSRRSTSNGARRSLVSAGLRRLAGGPAGGRAGEEPRPRRRARTACSTTAACAAATPWWRSAAASSAISPASSPPPSSAAWASCRCRRRCLPRWTPRLAARSRWTSAPARTTWAPSTSRASCSPTCARSRRCPSASCAAGPPRSPSTACSRGAPCCGACSSWRARR